MKPEHLLRFARHLELRVATDSLLATIFPNHGTREDEGRYSFAYSAIEDRSDLVTLLLSGDSSSQRTAQQQLFKDLPTDIAFLHGLAVVFREKAIGLLNTGQSDEQIFTTSVALWGILLSSRTFWDDFCQKRGGLDAGKQNGLLERTVVSILQPHSVRCGQDYMAKQYDFSRVHLTCINLWRMKPEDFMAELKEFHISFATGMKTPAWDFDETKTEIMNRIASGLLDDFAAILVEESHRLLEQGIDRLPKGIRKNYEAVNNYLEPFSKFGIIEPRVFVAMLTNYCDWCYDLYQNQLLNVLKDLVRKSTPVSDALELISTKGMGYLPENQAISQHYLLRGFSASDDETAIRNYEISLEWNPGNSNAEKLLNEIMASRAIKPALDQLKNGLHASALGKLDEAESQNAASNLSDVSKEAILLEITRCRFLVHIDRAHERANSFLFDEAYKDWKLAADYVCHPDDEVQVGKSASRILAQQAVFWVNTYPGDANARRGAKKQLEKALEMDPDNTYAKDNLRRI